jgi:hypothetical protein
MFKKSRKTAKGKLPKPEKASVEYRPDRPGRRDQPGSGQPGDEVGISAESRAAQEMTEAAIETGVIRPEPKKPSVTSRPGEQPGGTDRPPNPALTSQRIASKRPASGSRTEHGGEQEAAKPKPARGPQRRQES